MIEIYNTLLYEPLFNLMVFLYNKVPGQDIGIAIIIITIIIKAILYPFSIKMIKSQKALQDLQPKLEELKKKYTQQKEKLAQATMELYRQQKINPFSSCLPLIIQLPFFFAVYQVFRTGLKTTDFSILYSFIENPGTINPTSFGLIDLSQPSAVLAVLAGLAQWWSTKMLVRKKQPQVLGAKDEGMTSIMNKQMAYFMPIFTVIIGLNLPGGLTFYWLITTLLTIGQQAYFFRGEKSGQIIQPTT